MSTGTARLAARYPVVWHVIEADGAGAWLSETGLAPAGELRRVAGLPCNGANRSEFQRVDLGGGRTAILRLQQMPDHLLRRTLAGEFAGRPDLWRGHLDKHVFFWTEPRRRDAFIRACIRLRGTSHAAPVALTVDTAKLLERHAAIAFFATINTGSTVRSGSRSRRDENTLRPVADYQSGPVAELALRGRVDLSGGTLRET